MAFAYVILIFFSEPLVGGIPYTLSEEVLLIFPVISLLSSPSKSVKGAATDLLIMLERILGGPFASAKINQSKERQFAPISTVGTLVSRLLQNQWFQVYLPLHLYFTIFFFFFLGSEYDYISSLLKPIMLSYSPSDYVEKQNLQIILFRNSCPCRNKAYNFLFGPDTYTLEQGRPQQMKFY